MTTQNPAVHRCVHCSREFNRSEHLVRHERTHTKEKPYKCTVCPHAFARRDLLRRHELKAHRRGQPPRKVTKRNQSLAPKGSIQNVEIMDVELQHSWNALQTRDTLTAGGEEANHDVLNANFTVDALQEVATVPEFTFGQVEQSMQDYLLQDTGIWLDNLDTTAFGALDTLETLADTSSAQTTTPFSHVDFGDKAARNHILSQPDSPTLHDTINNRSMPKDHLHVTESCWRRMQLETRKTDPQYVLPSKDELSRFIARYFGSFHRHQPFLHEPTWSASRSPVMLVLAVCANGALYSLEQPTAFGLYKMAVQMTSLADEGIHALQTMMLLTAFAAWSGTKEDLRTALQFHGRLAFAIRQEWALLEYGEGAETTAWEAWLARESLKR
ncbi:C2H2 transcription factor [Colletotrichum chrysophilum]|uniref:C2H2 transcription factor n=1 Tax=Colletotrichum chrysophilum TaxID=1836956 RepID=A0AAD9EMS5_9PEZI|nr:C2H2 transcription factor [Colletotrichum chrysophilum]